MIHTTNNGFIDGLLPALHELRPLISYDFSYRWNEEDRVDRVCPYIDFGFLSCSDLGDEETKALCRRLYEKGCGVVTATRGSKGAAVYDGAQFYIQLPDYVTPIDTMGAGDGLGECDAAGAYSSRSFKNSGRLLCPYLPGKWRFRRRRGGSGIPAGAVLQGNLNA